MSVDKVNIALKIYPLLTIKTLVTIMYSLETDNMLTNFTYDMCLLSTKTKSNISLSIHLMETYTTICKIANGNLLYGSGNANRGSVST